MASNRILNRDTHSSHELSSKALAHPSPLLRLLGVITLCSLFIYSCGTTGKSSRDAGTEDAPEETAVSTEESADEASQEFIALLSTNRSSLDDVYSTRQSEMPDLFLESNSSARDIGDPNQGYRIQILSTRNVSMADSVASNFRFWAVDNMKEYIPEAYVLYRQPYYKVHVGNFQFREQAMQLNTLVKKQYPDAWIVPDEVEPELVPSDTLTFGREIDKQK